MRRIRGDVPELTWDQLLELVCGLVDEPEVFSAEHSFFDSEEERKAAWFANREEILAESGTGTAWGQVYDD